MQMHKLQLSSLPHPIHPLILFSLTSKIPTAFYLHCHQLSPSHHYVSLGQSQQLPDSTPAFIQLPHAKTLSYPLLNTLDVSFIFGQRQNKSLWLQPPLSLFPCLSLFSPPHIEYEDGEIHAHLYSRLLTLVTLGWEAGGGWRGISLYIDTDIIDI